MAGQEAINSVNGPLSPSLASLILYSSTILSSTSSHPPWSFDPKVVPMPWRSSEMILPRKLSFGVIRHDGVVRPHPPMERAIETVIKALIMEGHEVIDFKPYEHELGSYYLAVSMVSQSLSVSSSQDLSTPRNASMQTAVPLSVNSSMPLPNPGRLACAAIK